MRGKRKEETNAVWTYWYTVTGPIPLTYVDTGVYEGGSNDYYEVYTSDDLRRARHMNFVLNHHRVPRWDV